MSTGDNLNTHVDIDMLGKFFAAKGVKQTCLACGHTQLGISLGEAQNEIAAVFVLRDSLILSDQVIPMILLACGNCGCTRSHTFTHFQGWLNEQ